MRAPHCSHHTLEARKKHGSGQMNGLIGLSSIAFRGFASAQECEESLVEVERHQLRHGEHPILHYETAVEWACTVLVPMASQVKQR